MHVSGIAGIIDLDINDETIAQMLLSMKHRGPDGKAAYHWQGKTLLHTSLDSSGYGGAQPLALDWAGERYVIAFDGVVYNREEIRGKLKRQGHQFDSSSDAELILRGYASWQEGILYEVNGIFAFAIVMEQRGQVFLARDRIGVKPLFYKEHCNGLIFASELKTILSYPGVEACLDAQGVGELLLLGPGHTPGSGVFQGLREIEPGCYGVYRGGNLQLHRYWRLTDRLHQDTFEETAERVRFLLMDAVRMQMKSENSVGAMLSGGLDSSLVSAICARELDAQGKHLDTFSLDYHDNDKYFTPGRFQPNMDTDYIRIMQEQLDSQHHWTFLTPEDLVDEICNATIARDLPGMADVDTSLLAFCRQIKPHVGIVLSGECADEIFCGYPWYRDPEMRDTDGFPWARTTQERTAFLQDWLKEKLQPTDFIYDRYRQTINEADILPENSPRERRIKELVHLNFRWFMQTLLDRGDRMGSFCSLEIRVPFCDYRIAEYLYGVPWEYKDYKGYEKGLLRRSMEGVLPRTVLYRKKSPFPKTYDPKYLELVSKLLEGVLQDKHAPIFQIVSQQALKNLLYQDFPWPWYGQLMCRPQTIVYMLQINYWLEHYSVRIV